MTTLNHTLHGLFKNDCYYPSLRRSEALQRQWLLYIISAYLVSTWDLVNIGHVNMFLNEWIDR